MLPKVAETGKIRLLAYLSLFGAWSPCAPAFSCVVGHIRVCSDVFLLFLASPCASFCSLGLSTVVKVRGIIGGGS